MEESPLGKISFYMEMEQISDIEIEFKELSLSSLPMDSKECNPYIKYGFSKDW
jgi:hypothetical protein